MNVYDNPVNRFVAGFLGTPPMNFFDGRVEYEGDQAYFVTEDQRLRLCGNAGSFAGGYKGREMVLGVRPECMSLKDIEGQAENKLKSIVHVVEPLGDRMDVYLDTPGGQRYVANVDPHEDLSAREEVLMNVDVNRCHVFEPGETGRNVSLGAN
jgi:multiple sugar transport system ATP-binding protein